MAAVSGSYIAGAGRIIAVDTNPAKLQAATRHGATDLVNPADGDPVERIIEMTRGGVHHALECIGLKTAAEQAFQMLAAGGTATVVGLIPVGEKVELHGSDLLGERRLQGCSMGSNRFRVDMPRLIELYLQGRLHLDDWISQRISLQQINEGFEAMKAGEVIRAIIEFEA
jgi:S-(hydroxymethyl)glutathione dehydrogenase/alcohol dehydrogenase